MHMKAYHKMPLSSWMVPGGNRDQKRKLIQAQKYPMKSAIQKNLGGPLSEAFFSSLTPVQQDHIGYTPKLQGPGQNLWVSPSDNLIGKVILSPPYTTKVKQSLTHQGILQMGAEIEDKLIRAHELEMEAAVKEKEQEMRHIIKDMIRDAVAKERMVQIEIADQTLQTAQQDLSVTYQAILKETVDQLMAISVRRMEEAVCSTRRQLERELCKAVESHSHYLGTQYELQLAWRDNQLMEKYTNMLKKQGQKCTMEIEKIRKNCLFEIMRSVAQIRAEHITDLVTQACEKSQIHHQEKKHLESNFKSWFVGNFENEIVNRDFKILELEEAIRKLEAKNKWCESQLKDIFRHFQKFINCAFKEKPGQAEFLLSLEKELKVLNEEVNTEGEVEYISKLIIDYMLKFISERARSETKEEKIEDMKQSNFRNKLIDQRNHNRLLNLVGEERLPEVSKQGTSNEVPQKEDSMNNQLESLIHLFQRNPSVIKILNTLSKTKTSSLLPNTLEP